MADNDFLQVQDTQPPDEVDDMQRTHPFINHLEEGVQNYMQLIDKIIVISEDKITLAGDERWKVYLLIRVSSWMFFWMILAGGTGFLYAGSVREKAFDSVYRMD